MIIRKRKEKVTARFDNRYGGNADWTKSG